MNKANEIANYLGNQFIPHELCPPDREGRVVVRVKTLPDTVEKHPSVTLGPCDLWEEIRTLELGKACGFDDIPNECLRHLPRRLFLFNAFT
jgi:hypothetical protein